ncbi:MAG: YajQ family cyclic di-GMP-binding protein [Helicobacteraceae bacterium]|nr:YajQ family cyclic di-GMP-binding protein [Helicobacteraceae bacterium]
MAKEHSFDISAKIDMQHFKDAINLSEKEIATRYDFKGVVCEINYKEKEKLLVLTTSSDNKLDALKDIVIGKLLKRDLNSKALEELKVEDSSGGNRKLTYKVVDYIETKEAKKICADIKSMKLKVNAQIEGEYIRVKAKNIDDLQKVMTEIRSKEYDAPIIFENMR